MVAASQNSSYIRNDLDHETVLVVGPIRMLEVVAFLSRTLVTTASMCCLQINRPAVVVWAIRIPG